MQIIPMTLAQVESWTAQFTGDRSRIVFDEDGLHVPDDMVEAVSAIDVNAPSTSYLEAMKARFRRDIDEQAENERLKYITPGEGQALTYQRKVEEAKKAVLETNPAAADYPMLAASVGIDGADVKAVGTLVLAMDAQWTVIGAAIERRRMSAKSDVQAAKDEQAILAIMAGITWPDAPE